MLKYYVSFLLLLIYTQTIGQATVPFTCSNGYGYLFQNTTADVYQINLQTGASTLVKTDIVNSAVSAGFNPVDNFIWMVNKNTAELVKVDANWNITNYSTSLPTQIHVADVDANGIFYALTGTKIYRYNLNTNPPTQLSSLNTTSMNISDFAFNPVDGFIYGVAPDGRIYKINPSNGSSVLVRTIGGLPNQTYGAVYFDGNGTLYLSGNSNGNIYKISYTALTNPASTESAVLFSNGPSSGSNDGARCASAPLCNVGSTAPTLNPTSATNTCSSASVNLGTVSASNTPSGTVLTWHTGTPTTTANKLTNLTVTTSGTYYATFYDATHNCYSAASTPFVVTINPIPTTPTSIAVSNSSVCSGNSVSLSGSCSVGTINWYIGSTSGTFVGTGSPLSVSPTSTTNYVATCKRTSPNCESSASSPITVTVNPTPAAPTIVAGSSRICLGTSTTLTANGCTGTVNWSTGATGTSITVSPVVSTNYWATCTNAAGCTSSQSNSTVQITIAAVYFYLDKTNICSGESVTLTMGGCTGVSSRIFYANGTQIFSSTSGNTFTHTPASTTTYTAKCGLVDATACATNSTGGVTVNVTTTPTAPTLSGGTTICAGSSTTLTASGCAGGIINWSNSQIGNSITVSPNVTTTYTATCYLSGCTSSVSNNVTVTIESIPPVPTNLSETTICQGESVNLGGDCSSGTIKWYNELALTNVVTMPVAPTTSRSYYAVCATTNCKSSSVAVSVIVNAKPANPTSTGANPATICSGVSTVLYGTCSGGANIAFYTDNALTDKLTSPTVTPLVTTSYYAVCELAGCKSNSVTINVTVNPSPNSPSALTASTTICQGSSLLLNGTCPSGSTLRWYKGVVDASSFLGSGSGFSVNPTETTIYVATCKDNTNSCESAKSSNITITVATTPNTPTNFSVSSVAICSGTQVMLSGTCSSGTIHFYTDVALSNEVTSPHSPTTNTTYYASCVIGSCKSTSVSKNVTVTTTPSGPTNLAATKTTVCVNESTTLSGTCLAGSSLIWYTDASLTTTISTTVQPTATTTYYAACVNGSCKSSSDNIQITVIPTPPTPTSVSMSPSPICANGTYSLLANCSSGSDTWYSNAALTTIIDPNNRTATVPETFYVVCKSGNCNGVSVSFTTTVNPLPSSSTIVPSDQDLCLGGSITLSANGCVGTINWYKNGTSAGLTTTSISETPTSTTVYTATCTNTTTNCVSPISGSTTITVVAPPSTPSITISDNAVCQGENITLTSINCEGTIQWYETGNTTALSTVTPYTVTPLVTTSYYATCTVSTPVTAKQCESGSSDPLVVTVNAIPVVPTLSTSANAICKGESTTLTATGCTGTVNWSDGSSGASISVSPTSTTSYTATCTTNSCTSPASSGLTITVNEIPEAPTGLSAETICSGKNSALSGNCSSGSIQWYSDAALTITVTSPVSPTTNTAYYAVCIANNCQSTAQSVVVNVTETPSSPTVSATPPAICVGTSAELTGACSLGNIHWYSDLNLTTELSSTIVTPSTTTTYYAACINGTCKSSATNQVVTVNDLPAAPTLSASSTTVCTSANFTIQATGCSGTVNWSNGETGTTITESLTANQTYTASCTDANGCISPSSTPLEITVVPTPAQPTITPSNSEICPGGSAILTASSCSGTLNWYKSGDESTSLGTSSTLTVSPSESSSYFVTCVVSSASCTSGPSESASIIIKSLPTLTSIIDPTCTDASKAMFAFQTSGGSTSTVSVSNGLTATFDSDGRENDSRQVWVIENIPSNLTFNVTITENGCSKTQAFTAPACESITVYPVDIIWFKGEAGDNGVELDWGTVNEVSISKYDVERSENAVDFVKIGVVDAKLSSSLRTYQFVDTNPKSGINYYRLRIKELAIEDSYSKIIAIDFKKRAAFSWKVYPNPINVTEDRIIIETNQQAKVLGVDLFNLNGTRLKIEWRALGNGTFEGTIGQLPKNTYFLRLNTDAGFFTSKIIVTN